MKEFIAIGMVLLLLTGCTAPSAKPSGITQGAKPSATVPAGNASQVQKSGIGDADIGIPAEPDDVPVLPDEQVVESDEAGQANQTAATAPIPANASTGAKPGSQQVQSQKDYSFIENYVNVIEESDSTLITEEDVAGWG